MISARPVLVLSGIHGEIGALCGERTRALSGALRVAVTHPRVASNSFLNGICLRVGARNLHLERICVAFSIAEEPPCEHQCETVISKDFVPEQEQTEMKATGVSRR